MSASTKAVRLALAAAIAMVGLVATYTHVAAQPKERVIKIVAKRFDYTPGNFKLKKGEPEILEELERRRIEFET